jgi:hypothetical protein
MLLTTSHFSLFLTEDLTVCKEGDERNVNMRPCHLNALAEYALRLGIRIYAPNGTVQCSLARAGSMTSLAPWLSCRGSGTSHGRQTKKRALCNGVPNSESVTSLLNFTGFYETEERCEAVLACSGHNPLRCCQLHRNWIHLSQDQETEPDPYHCLRQR